MVRKVDLDLLEELDISDTKGPHEGRGDSRKKERLEMAEEKKDYRHSHPFYLFLCYRRFSHDIPCKG